MAREGIEFQVAVPMLFSLVYCRLELDDSRRALEGDDVAPPKR